MRNPHAAIEGPLSCCKLGLSTIGLGDHHVAAITAATFQITTTRGCLLYWRDHLKEVSTNWHQGVLEPKRGDTIIDVTDINAEDSR